MAGCCQSGVISLWGLCTCGLHLVLTTKLTTNAASAVSVVPRETLEKSAFGGILVPAIYSVHRVQIPPSAPSQETEEPQRFPGFSCIHAGLRDLFYRLTVPILSRSFALLANESLTKFTRQVPQYIPCKVLTSAALSISIPPSQAIRLRRGYALSFLKKVPFL